MPSRMTRALWHLLAGCTLLGLVLLAYAPGLSGPFLFDDFANLDALGAYGPLDDWRTFLYYLTSGSADPTGRPLALLTFLIDAQTWPADPWPFKRTNLVIHLLNTALLWVVITRLQAVLDRRRTGISVSAWAPLVAAGFWGAHPFLVSTTLYVVQREAMLPMTFVLLAILAWDRAILHFIRGKRGAGWLWATLGFGGCTVLAGLSKANGFLAPLLVGLAHLWFLRPTNREAGTSMDRAALVCLALPSALLVAYLTKHGWDIWSRPYLPGRDWTIAERLLSQPRALLDYLWHLVLPRSGGGGLFVEGFAVSRGWLTPATTLPAILALSGITMAALAWRRRFPVASFAWMFFLVAHLLESSVVALELYFEHRNYLPAAFLGWPVAHALLRPGSYARHRATLAVLLLLAMLVLTHQRATVWGNQALLAVLTATHEKDSVRSQVTAAQQEVSDGHIAAGLARIRSLQRSDPQSVIVAINSIALECSATGELSPDTLSRSSRALSTATHWNYGLYAWLRDAAYSPGTRECGGLGLDGLLDLVSASEANPRSGSVSRRKNLWHVRGQIALAAGQPHAALKWFDAVLELDPDAEYALVQAAALGNAGAQSLGVAHLDRYRSIAVERTARVRDMPSLHRWLLTRTGYYENELQHLRSALAADQNTTSR